MDLRGESERRCFAALFGSNTLMFTVSALFRLGIFHQKTL